MPNLALPFYVKNVMTTNVYTTHLDETKVTDLTLVLNRARVFFRLDFLRNWLEEGLVLRGLGLAPASSQNLRTHKLLLDWGIRCQG